MPLAEILAVGKLAGEVLNKLLDKMPNHDQKIMKKYFEFLEVYNSEITRENADFDYMLEMRERNNLLISTMLKGLRNGK